MNAIRRAEFTPAWWLRGPHSQTLWAAQVRRKPEVALRRERFGLDDGDFIDVDWTINPGGPLVVVLHGLEGSSDSSYARGLLRALVARGWRGAVMHFRGCSGEPNLSRRNYNAGDTADLDCLLHALREREPDTPLACVGYSLGANALLKWLGERGADAPVDAAVAVSVPFLLKASAERMSCGLSRMYQRHLLKSMHHTYRSKFASRDDAPVSLAEAHRLKNFYTFDDRITAPLHGYLGAEDYYARASSRQYLRHIRRPCLILHSTDDPFMHTRAIPSAAELADDIEFELSSSGGHVGFVEGRWPWRAGYWLERRIPLFLAQRLPTA